MMRALLSRRATPLHQRALRRASANTAKTLGELNESPLSGTSARYVEQMHAAWRRDPAAVHTSWRAFFDNVEAGVPPGAAFAAPPAAPLRAEQRSGPAPRAAEEVSRSMRAMQLIRQYQTRGHLRARTDPLGVKELPEIPEMTPEFYGFTADDLDKPITVDFQFVKGFQSMWNRKTLRQIIEMCEQTYCGSIGVEYMHIDDKEQCDWLRERLETEEAPTKTTEEKLQLWDRLAWAVKFELFLHRKFQDKRFGLDGGESTVLAIKKMIDHSAVHHGVESVTLGMAHRGRLNILANVLRKPLKQIFAEFEGKTPNQVSDWSSSGDVKYHLGTSCDRKLSNGQNVHLSLVANPSHLEAVNPVVEGKTFARQFYSGDTEKKRALSLVIHGDASFAGQGVVYETLEMSTVKQYTTGGTLHVVINNQIGFTTQLDVRAGTYCTDVAKSIGAPIFHVNGDDPEAVARAARHAADFRARFGTDVVLDVVCYRRYGHNEIDQPKFTQPRMYSVIDKMPSVFDLYTKKLVETGVATQEELDRKVSAIDAIYDEQFEASRTYEPDTRDWLDKRWHGFFAPNKRSEAQRTGVPVDQLRDIGARLVQLPDGFTPHRVVKRLLAERAKMFESGEGFDWATGEALAFATLALENKHVRLSGQDVERGTFSHRHSVLHDQKTFERYMPLNNLHNDQARVTITNSNLSEFGVLGFEVGYSMEDPHSLVLWEAQFGDFVNTAQVILDQFIASGEQKWHRQCGITLLLPHGHEGQGPEHSSARLERFLAASDQDPTAPVDDKFCSVQRNNLQVCNVTTPANYFHVLRRQIHRNFRKPLVLMSPKSLLRHRLAQSTLAEFDKGTQFQQVFDEAHPDEVDAPGKIKQLIVCSGKVYYDLLEKRRELGHTATAIVRLEQLAPFPSTIVAELAGKYAKAHVTVAQEEPMNMGIYTYMLMHLPHAIAAGRKQKTLPALRYVGRKPSAAPATGSAKTHKRELDEFLADAFAI